jgi:hypothetical protein
MRSSICAKVVQKNKYSLKKKYKKRIIACPASENIHFKRSAIQ